MVDFFKFKENLEEAKNPKVTEQDLEKDSDDPCWAGYVQVGTKMKDGKEVPNCVPMEEAKKMMNEDKVTDDHWAIVKQNGNFYTSKSEIKKIVKPSKNPPSERTIEKHGGDSAVKVGKLKKDLEGMRNTDKLLKQLSESFYDEPDYGQVGAAEMKITQLHFIKHAADEIIGCLESGCVMPEWYQNKVAKVEGEFEGLLSYMKGQKAKTKSRRYSMGMNMYEQFETLTEAKSGDKEAYQKFFNAALKKYGIDSPAELDTDEKKKEFFDYVDKNWKGDDETKNESVQIDEKTVPLDKLRKGQTYTVKMNGKKGKVKVDSIRMDGGEVAVKMTYMDNKIGKKGETETRGFDQGGDDDVFMESYITEVLKPSDDVSTWIEDFYKSDAPQFKGKSKEERREMAVAAWLESRREAGYDVPAK